MPWLVQPIRKVVADLPALHWCGHHSGPFWDLLDSPDVQQEPKAVRVKGRGGDKPALADSLKGVGLGLADDVALAGFTAVQVAEHACKVTDHFPDTKTKDIT